MDFEEFHFFYLTNFVFYLKHRQKLAVNPNVQAPDNNNLSLSILHSQAMVTQVLGQVVQWTEVPELDIHAWPSIAGKGRVQEVVSKTIFQFHTKITEFIKLYFKPFCGQLYNWNVNDADHFTQFFASPTRVKALVTDAENEIDLSVNKFIAILKSRESYWFPFKHITMVQIANALGHAYPRTHSNFQPMFSLWYHHAATSALLLSRAPSLVESHRAEQDDEDDDIGLLLSRRLRL